MGRWQVGSRLYRLAATAHTQLTLVTTVRVTDISAIVNLRADSWLPAKRRRISGLRSLTYLRLRLFVDVGSREMLY